MEEEITETESSLDEKEEESDEQKEEEWSSYPFTPSNDSNSSTLTLFDCPPCLPKEDECYVPMDSLEISFFDKTDTCYAYGYDVSMNETFENDEQLENEERKHPPSPPMDEGNTQNLEKEKIKNRSY